MMQQNTPVWAINVSEYRAVAFFVRVRSSRPRIIQDNFRNISVILVELALFLGGEGCIVSNFSRKERIIRSLCRTIL
jgi:hypothetical protein